MVHAGLVQFTVTPSFNRECLGPIDLSTITTLCAHLFQMTLTTYSIVLLLVATAVPACPQIRFEVASIRPSQPGTAQDARPHQRGSLDSPCLYS